MRENHVFCVNCGEISSFSLPPVEMTNRGGTKKRLVGICSQCGAKVSRFLPSEDGPTRSSVKVGPATLKELARASDLLERSRRSIVEQVLAEHIEAFVRDELEKLEAAGLITRSERQRRERELSQPIAQWEPTEPGPTRGGLAGLFRRLSSTI